MWSRKRLDIGWSDLLYGLLKAPLPAKQSGIDQLVEQIWPNPEHIFACLSVRTGFDLLLGALALPHGSEVLVSAITIPDMVRVIKHHGLVPVPVDLDPQTMSPVPDDWQRAVTPNTRAILVAHLFGGQTPMDPILDLAQRHKLFVFEDCAQAFAGNEYQGCPEADASMFSFGSIKSYTALGGALLRVRDLQLLSRMRAAHAAYPLQNRWLYAKRLFKYAGLKALSCRPVCAFFVFLCRSLGFNYDRWANSSARGFPGDELFSQIQHQPSPPLMAVLKRRLERFNARRLAKHVLKGRELFGILEKDVFCPGAASPLNTYWVFPVLVDQPEGLIEGLVREGFDATQGQSLCVVPPPDDRPAEKAAVSEEILAKIVFLPFYPELPEKESKRMAGVVLKSAGNKRPAPTPSNRVSGNNSPGTSAGAKQSVVH
jgi:perosamine synthetase